MSSARGAAVHPSTLVVLGGWFVVLMAVGSGKGTALTAPEPPPRPPAPRVSPTRVVPPMPALAPEPTMPATACGDPTRTPHRIDEWTAYSCRSTREVGLGRSRCLGWRSYATAREQGCPGDLVCCPSAPLAGAAPVPGELCVHDRRPPLIVREGPSSRERAVGELDNGTRVHTTHPEGEWMHIDAPMDGWVYIPWLGICGAEVAETVETDGDAESEETEVDPFAAARASLRARRVEAAVDAIAIARTEGHAVPDDVRQQLSGIGSNVVGNHLLAGNCSEAQVLFRRLRTVGADGAARAQFSDDWCAVPP